MASLTTLPFIAIERQCSPGFSCSLTLFSFHRSFFKSKALNLVQTRRGRERLSSTPWREGCQCISFGILIKICLHLKNTHFCGAHVIDVPFVYGVYRPYMHMKSWLCKEVGCALLSPKPCGESRESQTLPLEGCNMVQIGKQTLTSQEAEAQGRHMSSRAGLCGLGQGRWDGLRKNAALHIHHPVSPYS